MTRALVAALILMFLATAGAAGERPKGLMWNRSGLAATLPLQVKTTAEADYLLRLQDAATGEIVLAAYIRGGEYFRVLVPPGRYALIFASGKHWQGEEALFGPETQSFVLDEPLRFGATLSRKHGHLIDLTGETEIGVRDFALCQRLALDFGSLVRRSSPAGRPGGHPRYRAGLPPRDPLFPADRPDGRPDPERLLMPGIVTPRYDLRSNVCD